ncbi:Pro-Pol polyprotein [Trichinella patagoniensis]|uniref:Pro-Pol polyprotein n=1 Tax=Trichinella patagoniensis TaxID=990121 RepID=A0A0V0ZSH0_9BILA|nr:Pro-Pol polyprotein [Trichinella patagoniensis]
MEEIQRMTNSCRVCAELKPRFFKGDSGKLIKATAPFERLSIDFKGPLPSTSSNRYILTVVDEYSRFPFAFPCPDISTQTVSKCLTQLFYLFVGTGAHREEDERAEKPDANDITPENSESEEDTVTRQEHHQTPQRRSTRIRRATQRLQDNVLY